MSLAAKSGPEISSRLLYFLAGDIMARKLDQKQNTTDEPRKIAHLANLTGFDGPQMTADVEKILSLGEDVREASEPIKEQKAYLKSERGYHMGAFGVCVQMARKDLTEAKDMWRTIKAYAMAKGFDDPDLVDQAEGKA